MNTVLLVLHSRPEMFLFTARAIAEARGASNYLFVVALDQGFALEHLPLLDKLEKETGAPMIRLQANQKLGGIGNTMEGLRAAMEKTDEYTIILEDDHLVSRDFFETTDAMFRNFYREDILSLHTSSGRERKEDPDPPASRVLRANDYQPHGACIPKEQYLRYVATHCQYAYYRFPHLYLSGLFSESPRNWDCGGPDGLMWRICEKSELCVAKTAAGRVRHIGFYGLNREIKDKSFFLLPFLEKVKFIDQVIWDPDKLRELSVRPWDDYWHVEPDHVWDRLELVNPDFNPYRKNSVPA